MIDAATLVDGTPVIDVHSVSVAEDGVTVFVFLVLRDGRDALWTYTLGAPPGTQREEMTPRIV